MCNDERCRDVSDKCGIYESGLRTLPVAASCEAPRGLRGHGVQHFEHSLQRREVDRNAATLGSMIAVSYDSSCRDNVAVLSHRQRYDSHGTSTCGTTRTVGFVAQRTCVRATEPKDGTVQPDTAPEQQICHATVSPEDMTPTIGLLRQFFLEEEAAENLLLLRKAARGTSRQLPGRSASCSSLPDGSGRRHNLPTTPRVNCLKPLEDLIERRRQSCNVLPKSQPIDIPTRRRYSEHSPGAV